MQSSHLQHLPQLRAGKRLPLDERVCQVLERTVVLGQAAVRLCLRRIQQLRWQPPTNQISMRELLSSAQHSSSRGHSTPLPLQPPAAALARISMS